MCTWNISQISSLMFHRRKSVIQVWNDTRGSKWWQNFHRFFSIALRDFKMSMEIKNGKYISGTQATTLSGHCCTLSYCLLWLSSEIFVLCCPMFYRHLAIWNRPGLKYICRATIVNLDLLPLPCLLSTAILIKINIKSLESVRFFLFIKAAFIWSKVKTVIF